MTKKFLKTIAVVICISFNLMGGTTTAWGMWKTAIENIPEWELRDIINSHYKPRSDMLGKFTDHKPGHKHYRDDLNELKIQNQGTTPVTADLPADVLQYRIWPCKACSDMILDKEISRHKNKGPQQIEDNVLVPLELPDTLQRKIKDLKSEKILSL